MKERTKEETIMVVLTVIMDRTTDEELSEIAAENLAKDIVEALYTE